MLFDGKQYAEEVYARLAARRADMPDNLTLGIVCCEPDAVIESFVRIKARAAERLGIRIVRKDIPAKEGEQGIITAIEQLAHESHGIIVQLPLPTHFNLETILAGLPGSHDVDGIGGNPRVMPPVARAVAAILEKGGVALEGRTAVVVGAGRLVGAPVAHMLREKGARVQTLVWGDALDVLTEAEIIVSGAGSPGLISPNMIREGVVLIDAGTSEQGGKVRGDADAACAEKCALFTPVPGGVGPVAVAMIFENLFELACLGVEK
ncbi:MAG: hypothetical protein RLZZ342_692 [Candidatus Parcubacteria bacterium]